MAESTVPQFCECDSSGCNLQIDLPVAETLEIKSGGYIILVSGCETGPSPRDELVAQREGCALYRER